jgi:hypothetical protein
MFTANAVTQTIPSSGGSPIKLMRGANTLDNKVTAPIISSSLIIKIKGIRILKRGVATSLISINRFLKNI